MTHIPSERFGEDPQVKEPSSVLLPEHHRQVTRFASLSSQTKCNNFLEDVLPWGRSYEQLSLDDRCEIASLSSNGSSVRQIAAALDRSPSTISRTEAQSGQAGRLQG
ncbi:helix-turn-helix domain-containing protein [Bradyrhizobium yuanmingense]|uniref:helix-turn-helix domain-containing protein n=1 Tax=Bradyrhizobium yuanmingense TaxID=108015 RepID=UPI003D2EF0C6